MPTLHIFCHLERLGPVYDTGWVHFSLNLSAALDGNNVTPDQVRQFLALWAWPWKDLAVLGIDSNSNTVSLPDPVDPVAVNDTLPGTPTTDLQNVMEDMLGPSGSENLKPFLRSTPTTIDDQGNQNWQALLGHVSTFPAPFPQVLRFTTMFRVKESSLAGIVELVASPVFTADPFGATGPALPDSGTWNVDDTTKPLHRASQTPSVIYDWAYKNPKIPIVAHQRQCLTAPITADPNSFLDMQQLWVAKPTGFQRDWTLELESHFADAFDMARRLLDALRENLAQPAWTVDQDFQNAFLASLRDLANHGLSQPPEGLSLAEMLIRRFGGDFSVLGPMLRTSEQTRYAKLGDWITSIGAGFGVSVPNQPAATGDYLAALEAIHVALTDESKLSAFLMAEWAIAIGGTPFFQAQGVAITGFLGQLQLRKRMAFGNCGIAWHGLTGRLDDPANLKQTTQQAFSVYFDSRFADPPKAPYDRYFPPAGAPPAGVLDSITRFAAAFVDSTVLPQPITPDTISARNIDEDLAIQIDKIERTTDSDASDQEDFLRRLAGAGVLLRRHDDATPRPYRCLSLAKPQMPTSSLDLAVPAPLRFGYRNGVRQSFLSYRNQPMASESPVKFFSKKRVMKPDVGDDGGTQLMRYRNAYGASGEKLEFIAYGQSCDSGVFLIGVGGNLPKELCAFKDGKAIPWQFDPQQPPPVQQTISYLRRRMVGLVRLRSVDPRIAGEETEKLDVPPIPANVLPLARSLGQQEDTLLLLTPAGVPAWDPRTPHSFRCELRPPSVHTDVWDRWVAKDTDTATNTKRVQILAKYHEIADVDDTPLPDGTPTETKAASAFDLAIDDPAVTRFSVHCARIFPTALDQPPISIAVPPIVPTGADDLNQAQAPPVQVTIDATPSTLTLPKDDDTALRFQFPAGEVWKIEIAPIVSGSDLQRFEPGLREAQREMVRLIVEVPALLESTPANIKALADSLHLAFNQEHLRITLDKPSEPGLATLIHNLDIMLQRWRWDGRPVQQLPGVVIPDASIDGALFGSRESSDHLLIPRQADFVAAGGFELANFNLVSHTGALYYRGAVRAYSRYTGLLSAPQFVDSRADGQQDRWERIVAPCRWRLDVPRPDVKLVVPLTQTSPQSPSVPGLFVVLNQSWFSDSFGGLAESLEWEIAQTSLPDVSGDTRLQMGSDPILDMSEDPLAGMTVNLADAIGPVGFTFDTGTNAPLFTHAAFFLPAPTVVEQPDLDLSWYFLKIRFRIKLRMSLAQPGESDRAGEWTDPVWVQFLPPADLWRIALSSSPVHVADLQFGATVTGAVPGFLFQGNPVTIQPTAADPTGECSFVVAVLLTQPILDALGRRDQESYVDLVPYAKLTAAHAGLRARIVEIQSRQSDAAILQQNVTAIFDALFGDDLTRDAKARIVRVSPPVPTRVG